MSKRHFEPDTDDVFPTNHHRSTFIHNEGILDSCEEGRMESFSGGGWTRSRLNFGRSSSSGSGSIKRPRPDTLKPFDFSLINGKNSTVLLCAIYDFIKLSLYHIRQHITPLAC